MMGQNQQKLRLTVFMVGIMCMVLHIEAIVCPPNFCATVQCKEIKEEECDGDFRPTGGFCGCCPACVTILDLGATCFQLHGVPPAAECKEGTRCYNGTCQPLKIMSHL